MWADLQGMKSMTLFKILMLKKESCTPLIVLFKVVATSGNRQQAGSYRGKAYRLPQGKACGCFVGACLQAMAGESPPSPFLISRQQADSARFEVVRFSHCACKWCSRASRHDDGFVDGVKKLHAGQHRAIRRMTFPSADASPGDIPDFTLGVVIGRYVEKVIAVVDQTRQ